MPIVAYFHVEEIYLLPLSFVQITITQHILICIEKNSR